MLFVAPPGSISDAMIAAIEREFSWISVRNVQEVKMACMPFDLEVQLILVDRGFVRALQPWLAQLARVHPYATAAVTAEARSDCSDDLAGIIAAGAVRGVLPMDVNLDIWLSIIRIMLKGGEYFPSALFQKLQRLREVDNTGGAPPVQSPEPGQSEQGSETMDGLTGRELEVLAMVARGHQNKIIAADLGLSEHTVKIHLHNIIRKLGVHNRTEAAAKYFDHVSNQEEADDDAPDRDIAARTDASSAS
jgi:DNA-binding NarL/FixJ family response regulator